MLQIGQELPLTGCLGHIELSSNALPDEIIAGPSEDSDASPRNCMRLKVVVVDAQGIGMISAECPRHSGQRQFEKLDHTGPVTCMKAGEGKVVTRVQGIGVAFPEYSSPVGYSILE